MIAEVGDIENVSGSRIATPLAPPSPGSTPMITPSRMPTTITIRLNGCMTTAKPWNRLAISSMFCATPAAGLAVPRQNPERLDRPLRQRHQEPFLEHQEDASGTPTATAATMRPAVAAEPLHEDGDEQDRGDVEADPADQRDVDRSAGAPTSPAELAPFGEQLGPVAFSARAARLTTLENRISSPI